MVSCHDLEQLAKLEALGQEDLKEGDAQQYHMMRAECEDLIANEALKAGL